MRRAGRTPKRSALRAKKPKARASPSKGRFHFAHLSPQEFEELIYDLLGDL